MQKSTSPDKKRRLLRLLWHPHQGLWNWTLLRLITWTLPDRPFRRAIIGTIIGVDTSLLWLRALARRVKKVGIAGLFSKTRVPHGRPVLYFDLGLHKEARELSLMISKVLPGLCDDYRAYGFEASTDFFNQARQSLGEKDNLHLTNAALCGTVPAGGSIKLYKGGGDGLGSSVYRDTLGDYEEVQAVRFSDWIKGHDLDLKTSICLLRMNIEGSERDVLEDLADSGLAQHIDGYFGMWDDLSKIDRNRDDEFRAFLMRHRIHPFTFNGRDLWYPFRIAAIEYDIATAVQAGIKRLNRLEATAADAGTS